MKFLNFPRALTGELKRVAQKEEISMEELVAEVAQLAGKSTREIYNWRSGKWSPAVNLVPVLCDRFGSLALAEAIAQDCAHVIVEVPDTFDLARTVSVTVRDDLRCYERFLDAFESDGIQPEELPALRENAELVVRNAYRLVEIAAADCERRQARKNEQPTHYAGARQHHER